MDYKKIIRSQQLRFRVLGMLNWVPDSVMLRIQYRIKFGFWPNFKHPKRYTEKLQLYKMKYRNPVMPQCVDKYEVRKYVEAKGLGHILNELYGVYDSFDDIDFNNLPSKFVVKSTTGGGGFNVIVVQDKNSCDWKEIGKKVKAWSQHKIGAVDPGREWAYSGMGKSRIIIEKFLENSRGDSLNDYKFLCFDGKVKCLWVDTGRYLDHKRGFFNETFQPIVVSYGYPSLDKNYKLPINIDEMAKVAEILSAEFPHARIDLYNTDGKILFGEITFYCSSGYRKFEPDSFDFDLGSYFTEYT